MTTSRLMSMMRSSWSPESLPSGNEKKVIWLILFVYKFHSQGQLYLLGYTLDDGVQLIYLEAIGSHENFYRDLKR
jgi:mRNA interferase RelE/StbE